MSCKIIFNGREYTEEQFKVALENGLLFNLLDRGIVSLDNPNLIDRDNTPLKTKNNFNMNFPEWRDDIVLALQKLFGLGAKQSDFVAKIYQHVAESWAKRHNSKTYYFWKSLAFFKPTELKNSNNLLFKGLDNFKFVDDMQFDDNDNRSSYTVYNNENKEIGQVEIQRNEKGEYYVSWFNRTDGEKGDGARILKQTMQNLLNKGLPITVDQNITKAGFAAMKKLADEGFLIQIGEEITEPNQRSAKPMFYEKAPFEVVAKPNKSKILFQQNLSQNQRNHIDAVIKGFGLVPTRGFGIAFKSKNGKIGVAQLKAIQNWAKKEGLTGIQWNIEKTYGTINAIPLKENLLFQSNWYETILNKDSLNKLRSSLRAKFGDSDYTLGILDAISDGLKNKENIEDEQIADFIDNGISFKEIASSLYNDDRFGSIKEALNYLSNIGNDLTVAKNINQSLINKAISLSDNIKGIYKEMFMLDPEGVLKEAAFQAQSSPSERSGAIKTFGEEFIKIAEQLYPNNTLFQNNTEELIRGNINYFDEPGFKERNPNFNHEAYVNTANKFGLNTEITEDLQPYMTDENGQGLLFQNSNSITLEKISDKINNISKEQLSNVFNNMLNTIGKDNFYYDSKYINNKIDKSRSQNTLNKIVKDLSAEFTDYFVNALYKEKIITTTEAEVLGSFIIKDPITFDNIFYNNIISTFNLNSLDDKDGNTKKLSKVEFENLLKENSKDAYKILPDLVTYLGGKLSGKINNYGAGAYFANNELMNQKAQAAILLGDTVDIIYSLTNPNVSSPLHELAHKWEKSLTNDEKKKILNWANHDNWTRDTSEAFARGFEKYLADGVAPNSILKELFDSFKEWLRDIYKGIIGSDIDVTLNDDMRQIYASMLGQDFENTIKNEVQQHKKVERIQNVLNETIDDETGVRWMTPIPENSIIPSVRRLEIQDAFRKKAYDNLLLNGEITESDIKRIMSSAGINNKVLDDIYFRIQNQGINYTIENLNNLEKENKDQYQRVLNFMFNNNTLLDAFKNGGISIEEAKHFIDTLNPNSTKSSDDRYDLKKEVRKAEKELEENLLNSADSIKEEVINHNNIIEEAKDLGIIEDNIIDKNKILDILSSSMLDLKKVKTILRNFIKSSEIGNYITKQYLKDNSFKTIEDAKNYIKDEFKREKDNIVYYVDFSDRKIDDKDLSKTIDKQFLNNVTSFFIEDIASNPEDNYDIIANTKAEKELLLIYNELKEEQSSNKKEVEKQMQEELSKKQNDNLKIEEEILQNSDKVSQKELEEIRKIKKIANNQIDEEDGFKIDKDNSNILYEDVPEGLSKEDKAELLDNRTMLINISDRFSKMFPSIKIKVGMFGTSFKGRINNNVIELNFVTATKDTPIHEFMHPFIIALKNENYDLYQNLTMELQNDIYKSVYISNVKENKLYSGLDEVSQIEEALAQYLGESMAEYFKKSGNIDDKKLENVQDRFFDKFFNWFQNFINRFLSFLNDKIKYFDGDNKKEEINKNKKEYGVNYVNIKNLDKDGKTYNTYEYKDDINATYSISLKDLPSEITLQDIQDILLATTKLKFDLSASQAAIDNLQAYQHVDSSQYLKTIKKRMETLLDTERRVMDSKLATSDAKEVRRILDNYDGVEAIAEYVRFGINGIEYAANIIRDVKEELKRAKTGYTKQYDSNENSENYGKFTYQEGKLTQDDYNRLHRNLKEGFTLLEFYSDVKKLQDLFNDSFTKDEINSSSTIFNFGNSVKNQIDSIARDLMVEELYPKLQELQTSLPDDKKLSKEKFALNLKYAQYDDNSMMYWMGALINTSDPVNALLSVRLKDVLNKNHIEESEKLQEFNTSFKKFLSEKGVSNNIKAVTEYYKNNYLRKAKLWEVIKIDENGEKHYDYVYRDAYHEQYKWDEYEDDLRLALDKYRKENGSPKSSDDWEDFENFKADWMVKNHPTKNNKYLNNDFNKLKTDQHFQLLYDTYKKGNEKYGERTLKYGIIPQAYKKGSWVSGKWQEIKNAPDYIKSYKDKTLSDKLKKAYSDTFDYLINQDIWEKEQSLNLDGSYYQGVKSPFTHLINPNDVDLRLSESTLAFFNTGNNFDSLRQLQANFENYRLILNGNVKLGIEGRKAVKFAKTSNGDKIPLLDKPDVKGTERLNKQINSFLNDIFYGDGEYQSVFNVGDKQINLNNVGSKLGFLTALNNLAGNVIAGVSNVIIGNIQSMGEATGGKYYNRQDWAKAQSQYIKSLLNGDFLLDVTKPVKSKITQLGIIYDAIQGEFRDKYGKNITGNIIQKYATKDSLFLLSHIGEHQIQLTGFLALMNSTKVKLNNGEEISLFDAYIPNKNGFYKIREDVEWSNEDNDKFTRTLHGISKDLNGNYASFDKSMAQRYWLGKLALQYRKYLWGAWKSRFSSKRYDYERQSYQEGYYRSFSKKLVSDIANYKFNSILKTGAAFLDVSSAGVINKLSGNSLRNFSSNGLSQEEAYAQRKTLFDLSIIVGTTLLATMIGGGEDDDDYAKDLLMLQTLRLYGDISQYSVTAPAELVKIMLNPAAGIKSVSNYLEFTQQLLNDSKNLEFEEYKTSGAGYEEGDTKLGRKAQKLIPIYRQWLRLQAPKDQLKYFTLINKDLDSNKDK